MRLLKIETGDDFSLVELKSDEMQPYAVLSHVWGKPDQEGTFRDIMDKTGKQKVSFDKISFCAKQAEEDKIQYFWVDTCCIDNSSSAELSEAINSMYHWYDDATICYAYMSDVSCPEGNFPVDLAAIGFPQSEWFERGWTLQELIAPPEVVFYSKEWRCIGTKLDLAKDLTKITGIDGRVLGGAHPSVCSIAARMSWAAKRKTTREEDIAYSLLGIFDINMPLLYGQRGKAFIRLQEELMKASDDQSVFAWKSSDSIFHAGLLAISPRLFDASGSITWPEHSNGKDSSSMTSRGIRATFDLEEIWSEAGTHLARLACYRAGDDHQYAIVLQHVQEYEYIRINPNVLKPLEPIKRLSQSTRTTLYVRQNLFQPLQQSRLPRSATAQDDTRWFWIRGTQDLHFSEPVGSSAWYPDISLFGLRLSQIGRVLVTHRELKEQKMSLLFGLREGHPFCRLDDSVNMSYHLPHLDELGLGTSDQLLMRNGLRLGESRVSMTARVSQVKIRSCPCTVVTLCLKTV